MTDMLLGHGRPPSGDSIFFIGNATVLLRYAGFTILTDPSFVHRGESVPLGYGLSTTRLVDPAAEIDDLPPLDFVLLSHFHGDHFDQAAEQGLDRGLAIVTNPEAAAAVEERGFTNTTRLETWETLDRRSAKGRLRLTALPAKHAPAALAVALPDVMGSLLELWRAEATGPEPSGRLYVSGDTIMHEGLREIPERHPEIDLALVHLGGTRVMGVTVTMDADQGVEFLQTIRPRVAVPIHYDDYDAFTSPLEDFVAAVRSAGIEQSVRTIRRGESLSLEGAIVAG